MDLGLRDATAVVTGGTKGMGRATAEFLARDGARVAVPSRSGPTVLMRLPKGSSSIQSRRARFSRAVCARG